MFDFGWWELAIVGLMMILVLGPKELPRAMRSIARFMRKARRLASEFQGHVDDIIREAELDEVKDTVRSIKNQDVNAIINDAVDPGGELTKELKDTMADARREMNDIKASAGPTPTASIAKTEKGEQSDQLSIAQSDTNPAETKSTEPAPKPAETPPAVAGTA